MSDHKDFFGQPINVGDEVAFTAPSYRHLTLARVVKFAGQYLQLEFNNTWNYGPGGVLQTHRASPADGAKFILDVIG